MQYTVLPAQLEPDVYIVHSTTFVALWRSGWSTTRRRRFFVPRAKCGLRLPPTEPERPDGADVRQCRGCFALGGFEAERPVEGRISTQHEHGIARHHADTNLREFLAGVAPRWRRLLRLPEPRTTCGRPLAEAVPPDGPEARHLGCPACLAAHGGDEDGV